MLCFVCFRIMKDLFVHWRKFREKLLLVMYWNVLFSAIYLNKRLMRNEQKHGLEEDEVEAYNKLLELLGHMWDFITVQAEMQLKIQKVCYFMILMIVVFYRFINQLIIVVLNIFKLLKVSLNKLNFIFTLWNQYVYIIMITLIVMHACSRTNTKSRFYN